jgi:hypothetical protein
MAPRRLNCCLLRFWLLNYYYYYYCYCYYCYFYLLTAVGLSPGGSSPTFLLLLLFLLAFTTHLRVLASSFLRFRDHTQWRTSVGRTPLDEWSARRRDLYLATHNTHNRQTSMPPAGFEPATPASDRLQTHTWDRSPTLVQTKIKIHKTTITTKQLVQNIKNTKQQNNYKTIKISTQTEHRKCK